MPLLLSLLVLFSVVLPKNEILVKGAVPAASDAATPVPERGNVAEGRYRNDYFGLSMPIPKGWSEQPAGPPPSDGGSYVLTQFAVYDAAQKRLRANVLLSAQDLFFSALPASGAKELAAARVRGLDPVFKIERAPEEVTLAGRTFVRFGYTAPAAGLHWRILSTDVRCHALTFTLTGNDAAALDDGERALARMSFAGGAAPLCLDGYARGGNVVEKTDAHFTTHRYNTIPVRVVIDAEGRVKHVHVLSAFPDQADAILAALREWKFKPCVRGDEAVEIETGIVFGAPRERRTFARR